VNGVSFHKANGEGEGLTGRLQLWGRTVVVCRAPMLINREKRRGAAAQGILQNNKKSSSTKKKKNQQERRKRKICCSYEKKPKMTAGSQRQETPSGMKGGGYHGPTKNKPEKSGAVKCNPRMKEGVDLEKLSVKKGEKHASAQATLGVEKKVEGDAVITGREMCSTREKKQIFPINMREAAERWGHPSREVCMGWDYLPRCERVPHSGTFEQLKSMKLTVC